MSANEPKKERTIAGATPTIDVPGSRKDAGNKRPKIPQKWRKHRKRLLTLRAHLEAKRRNHAMAVREPLESFSMDIADAATDEFDHALALSELSAEQAALYEIDEALSRIQNGTYGICEITGKPIPEARLNALPWTRFSGVVERRLERQGDIRRPQLGKLHSVTGRILGKLTAADVGEETAEVSPNDEALFPHKYPDQHLKDG